jgi:hypothetical protein
MVHEVHRGRWEAELNLGGVRVPVADIFSTGKLAEAAVRAAAREHGYIVSGSLTAPGPLVGTMFELESIKSAGEQSGSTPVSRG